jgi:superfamily II DNA or RNA helicase
MSEDRVRYLLADEVGLGKTIEAGLILRELKMRGMVKRTLVVAPKGLVSQWAAEMRTRFGEDFRVVIPSDFPAYRRLGQQENVWQSFSQVVCPVDSIKPVEGRRGWSRTQTAEYNRERFEDLVSAGWDLVIVDEAHRLGGSTDQVARYRLGQGLAEAAPYLLLLTATPHQGKTDAFHRLVSLLDKDAFPDAQAVERERVRPYVIRTEKRRAIDSEGKPLFKPRRTQLIPVAWQERHQPQRLLYEAVTEYVREVYNLALKEKRSYIGFLMILMQRLVTSSTNAIRTTLERRQEVLNAPDDQLSLFPANGEEDWTELDGQEQLEMLLKARVAALKDERAEVKVLLDAARRCTESGPDVKAEALLDWIYRLQQEEGDPDLKILVFTEFVPTQEMLSIFLTERGFSVVCLNGSMNLDERLRAQERFAGETRIMISTEAGGEGLNLQFCHVVVNYDIPWNPMRLEQRIGRVDRIGQTHMVRAVNFVIEDSVEHRVREVLEEKLAVILNELGIDKTGDVLDSAQAEQVFDDLYVEAILRPETVDNSVDKVLQRIRGEAVEMKRSTAMLDDPEALDPGEAQRLASHPLPHWVEQMTVSYLLSHGGKVEQRKTGWDLAWPDGTTMSDVVFTARDAARMPAAHHLTLENDRVRALLERIPRFVPGQPIPTVRIRGLSSDIQGLWSLWRVGVHAEGSSRHRILPLFLHEDGRCLTATAKRVWDDLLGSDVEVTGHVDTEQSKTALSKLQQVAESHGQPLYDELLHAHQSSLEREEGKGTYSFAARRRVVERIGLPAVREHRLAQLRLAENSWREQLVRKHQPRPELTPLLILRVNNGGRNG